jgi:hypothetical protein
MTEETERLLTLGLAAAATAFGILNTIFNIWQQRNRAKVKLALTWKAEEYGGGLGKAMTVHSVRVENRSDFAVTIDDVDLRFRKKATRKISFSQTVEMGEDTTTKPLPIRVEARDVVTLTSDSDEPDSVFREFDLRYLCVRTACGVVKKVPVTELIRM